MSVSSAVRRVASSAIMTGALLASSAVVAHAQHFIASGGNVSVRFVFASAADRSVLSYKIGGASALGGTYSDLFANQNPGFDCIGISRPTTNVTGDQCNIGPVAAGTEVYFRLTDMSFPGTYYASDNSPADAAVRAANSDGNLHTMAAVGSGLAAVGGGTYTQGFTFEDRPYTAGQPINTGFLDFNDLAFEVAGVGPRTVTPEPSSVALMVAGLMAIGVVARRRRSV